MKTGWNTWNVRSVLSHVLLPECFAISLGVKSYTTGCTLREALVGRRGPMDEVIVPGPHAYDGSFTSLTLEWGATPSAPQVPGVKMKVETAVDGGDWFAVVTPMNEQVKTACLTIEAGVLWGRPGSVGREGNTLVLQNSEKRITVAARGAFCEEPVPEISAPYLMVLLDEPVRISSNPERVDDAPAAVAAQREAFLASRTQGGEKQDVYDAMQTCLAWDTIYDPFKDQVLSPVSRIWSCRSGGWVLFDWDTYFAAWMAGIENKELAYSNAIAITGEATESGFIPNFAKPWGFKSRDRSQPPVGALTVRALCDMFGETVLAEKLFDALLAWNRWWPENREQDGYLCWGSNPYEPLFGHHFEVNHINNCYAAALESGLDNSPMYEQMPYDTETHRMQLADVGLMSFYICDCRELAELARRIGRDEVAPELEQRAERFAESLKTLWCEETGLYLNKRLDNGELQHRLSPTHFYPLLAEVPTQEQAQRMIDEHFFNPEEFWGDYILPSIARNDPLYPRQDYWQGRIWAPMNFLVYLGLCKYDLPKARKALVEKSETLLLQEWREKGHVHENYCGDTGVGCDKGNSDAFYHWGGLLGLISVLEKNAQ